MARYNSTEQIGVHAVAHLFASSLGWIFREQPIADMGIDAQVELVEEEPTGQLVGIQIKTGPSHFTLKPEGLVYYGSKAHLDYWLGHRLPVLLVAHLPESEKTYWVQVQEQSIERTSKGWKILIPYSNTLDSSSRSQLAATFKGSERDQRLRRLALDEELMRHVQSDGRVSIEMEDWYNKSLGRSPIKVIVYADDGEEEVVKEWFVTYAGYRPKALVEAMFPWASAGIDQLFYDDYADFEDSTIPYSRDPESVYPYMDSAGEVASYRLQLFLNDLGEAYLLLSDHLNDSE